MTDAVAAIADGAKVSGVEPKRTDCHYDKVYGSNNEDSGVESECAKPLRSLSAGFLTI